MQNAAGFVDIEVGGIVFEGRPGDLRNAYVLENHSLDDGVEIRRNEVSRPTSHGSFDAQGFMSSRLVTLSGSIIAESPTMLRQMARRLRALLADGSKATLTERSDLGERWCEVRLAAQTTVTILGAAPTVASYQIQFWSPDPYLFGQQRRTALATEIWVEQQGTMPASPTFFVEGSGAGYSIISVLGTYTVAAALSGGSVDRIDMASGWLFRDGQLMAGAVSRAQTWQIPPYGRWLHQVVPLSGSFRIRSELFDTDV